MKVSERHTTIKEKTALPLSPSPSLLRSAVAGGADAHSRTYTRTPWYVQQCTAPADRRKRRVKDLRRGYIFVSGVVF